MNKAVIFDLDGVIVHTDKFHYLSWKALADELGIYFDEEINNRCRGISRADSLNVILERSEKVYTEKEKADFAERKNSLYRRLLEKMTPMDVDKSVTETLSKLKARGYKIAVGSGSKNAALILSRVGLFETFDAVADGTMIERGKPFPDVFLKAAELLGVNAENCFVVEDAEAGIAAGKAAGMKTFAIGPAATSNTATYNISKLSDILSILKD